MHEGLYKKIGEWANSRLDESVSDLLREKIRLGEFKAVYSIHRDDNISDLLTWFQFFFQCIYQPITSNAESDLLTILFKVSFRNCTSKSFFFDVLILNNAASQTGVVYSC